MDRHPFLEYIAKCWSLHSILAEDEEAFLQVTLQLCKIAIQGTHSGLHRIFNDWLLQGRWKELLLQLELAMNQNFTLRTKAR